MTLKLERFSSCLADVFFWLNTYNFFWIFLVVGIILILIDYFFETDVPCQFAYILFGCSAMLIVNCSPLYSFIIGVGVWVILVILHVLLFRKYLENAPEK